MEITRLTLQVTRIRSAVRSVADNDSSSLWHLAPSVARSYHCSVSPKNCANLVQTICFAHDPLKNTKTWTPQGPADHQAGEMHSDLTSTCPSVSNGRDRHVFSWPPLIARRSGARERRAGNFGGSPQRTGESGDGGEGPCRPRAMGRRAG